jgi:uncharacterized LabA/DUF88 family protein
VKDRRVVNWAIFGRISVFIDVANVVYSLKDLGWRIDYKKFQSYFKTNATLVDIYFYYSTHKENTGQANLLAMLARKGFKMVIKDVKVITRKNTSPIYKGNCDVELTIDVIDTMVAYDTAIFLSGDSDFRPLIEYIQMRGKKAVTISSRHHISKELIEVSDAFMWLNWFRDDWQRG